MTTTLQHVYLSSQQWTTLQKILFRFFCTYFLLYCFPFPLDTIEWLHPLLKPIFSFQDWWVSLVGKQVFNIQVKDYHNIYQRTADTHYGFVFMFTIALVALLATFVWMIADRRRINHEKLYQWLRLYLRFYLAFHLFNYGFIKIFPSQFPDASASRLVQTVGDGSPASLAWNFMGYSEAFMRFTGLAEVTAGLLLLFRRTTTLGSLLAFSVLSTVVMMNLCYGIGVKLFSLHFLTIALFLFLEDSKRLVHFFILNKAIDVAPELPLIQHPLGRKILLFIQIGLGIWMLNVQIADARSSEREFGYKFPKPLFYGVYKTEFFLRNDDTIPSVESDSLRWKQLVIDDGSWKQSSIHFSNGNHDNYNIQVDTISKTMQVQSLKDPSENYLFDYSLPDTNRILINGIWNNDSIRVMLKKYDLNNYRLHRTKFKWIVD